MSQVHLRVSLTIFHGGPQEKMTVDPKEDMIDQLEEVGGGTALWEEAGGGGGKSIHFATSTKSLGRVSSTVKNKRLADWKKVTKIFVSKKTFSIHQLSHFDKAPCCSVVKRANTAGTWQNGTAHVRFLCE